MSHLNAFLAPKGRLQLARCIVDGGLPLRRAAERLQPKDRRPHCRVGRQWRANKLISSLRPNAWRTRTAGAGTKVDRRCSWARINGPADTGEHWLLAPGP